uniref:Thioredoxin domain-containing protein n=1 Tax=viral metagenome TaxID=1070528 RepID=A0A6C0DR85_9ZZZZ
MVSKSYKASTPTDEKIDTPLIVGVIHAEWCGHCQQLMPEWKKLEDEYENNNKVKIMKLEASESNKADELNKLNSQIKGGKKVEENGYPTIFMIKGGNLLYNEKDRSVDGLRDWIQSNLSPSPAQKKPIQGGGKKRTRRNRKSRKQVIRK